MNGRFLWLVLSGALVIEVNLAGAVEPPSASGQEGHLSGWKIALNQLNAWWKSHEPAPIVDSPRLYTESFRRHWRPATDRPIGTPKQYDEAMKLQLLNHRRTIQNSLENARDPLR